VGGWHGDVGASGGGVGDCGNEEGLGGQHRRGKKSRVVSLSSFSGAQSRNTTSQLYACVLQVVKEVVMEQVAAK
jgi:hypothetical protein